MKKLDDLISSLKRSHGVVVGLTTLSSLIRIYENVHDSELLEYVPIKIVSLMEEHFRQIYREIIDNKEYRGNLKKVKFLKDMRFDFDVIDAFQNQKVTLGDYLSYHFPCSSVSQIFDQFGQLLGVDFRSRLIDKIAELEGEVELPKEEARINIVFFFKSIDMIFQMRHVLCHEGGIVRTIDNDFVMQMISDSQLFVEYTDHLISDIMYPNFDYTQASMNKDAKQSFEASDKQLTAIIKYLKDKDAEDVWNFSYMEEWKKYREAKAVCDSKCCEGGSMYPSVYYSSLYDTTSHMISQLKVDFHLYDWGSDGRVND